MDCGDVEGLMKEGKMKWVSVKERSPKQKNEWGSCQWLIKRKGFIPTVGVFINGRWEEPYGITIFDVTHWMPLPGIKKLRD